LKIFKRGIGIAEKTYKTRSYYNVEQYHKKLEGDIVDSKF